MSNKTYDTIKSIALIITPIVVLISSLLAIWQVPYAKEITASLASIDAFAGAFVLVAKKIYDGDNEPKIGGTD